MEYLYNLFFFVIGACLGSFLNVAIFRLPNDLPLTGRSQCPYCKATLTPLQLIPILSWLMLRGKCAKCKHAISFQYPLIEVVTGIFFVFTWFQLGPYFLSDYLLLFRNWFVILICIAVFVIDLRHKLILDVITFPSIILLLVCNIWLDYLQGSFLTLDSYTLGGLVAGTAASLLFYLFWFFSKGTWIGFGDVKFAWVMGLALGFPGALFAVMLAAYLGVFVSIPLLLLKKASFKTQLPFGCFLSASVLVLVFFSSTLLDIYIKYFAVY